MTDKQLDKFYTKEELAIELIDKTKKILNLNENTLYLEPSAGSGNFSRHLNKVHAFDIKPEGENIKQANFLELDLEYNDYVAIGNPPFGNRCSLAIDFFNKCSFHSKSIAMILPITFLKWSVQKHLNPEFKLIYTENLEENSFTLSGEEYSVRCCFQIWTKEDIGKDLRLKKAPAITHEDFKIWQHNATENSRHYLDEDWELAYYRQGYKDYNKIFYKDKDYAELKDIVYNTNIQIFFIKPKDEKIRERIINMDLNILAKRNMTTPGFGKADFVAYYEELFKED